MPLEYEDLIPLGTGDEARDYHRRPRELVIHFEPGLTDAAIDGEIAVIEAAGGAVPEDRSGYEPFLLARKRVVTLPVVDGPGGSALRRKARALERRPAIRMATPVYAPDSPDNLSEAATPLPTHLYLRIAPGEYRAVSGWLSGPRGGYAERVRSSGLLPRGFHHFARRPGLSPDDGFTVLRRVKEMEGVVLAEHDWLQIVSYQVPPTDPLFPLQWGLQETGWERAHASATPTAGRPVVVIDSGFTLDHPDLAGAFDGDVARRLNAEALWEGETARLKDVGPTPSPDGQSFPHGTCVAGILAARTDNADGGGAPVGMAGVAGGLLMTPVKVGDAVTAGKVAAAIGWAARIAGVAPGSAVANLSLTTVATGTLAAAVAEAADTIVLCAAAGNVYDLDADADRVGFPARHPQVLGVGAVDLALVRQDGRDRDPLALVAAHPGDPAAPDEAERWASRFGAGLDVVAPGVGLVATDLPGPDHGWNSAARPHLWLGRRYRAAGDAAGDYFFLMGGTSGATPFVSGTAALIADDNPGIGAAQIRHVVIATARKLPGYAFTRPQFLAPGQGPSPTWNPEVGFGFLDMAAAIAEAPHIAALPPPVYLAPADECPKEGALMLVGYVARALAPGEVPSPESRWRIFRDAGMTTWTEVRGRDVVADEPTGAGPRRVWIRRGARLVDVTSSGGSAWSRE